MIRKTCAAIAVSCLATTTAHSQNTIKDCDSALVLETYNRISRDLQDWRMAEHVEVGTYDEIKKGGGFSGVIYGVPAGANYDEFRKNIAIRRQGTSQSYSREQFVNVSWTGLDPNSPILYKACLQTVGQAMRRPLILIPKGGTAADIAFHVIYTVSGKMPNPVRVTWKGIASNSGLPTELWAGETGIVVPRPPTPADNSTLVLNSFAIGNSESIVLTALPAPLKLATLIDHCVKTNAAGDKCVRCEFKIDKNSAQHQWQGAVCTTMPENDPVKIEFNGSYEVTNRGNGSDCLLSEILQDAKGAALAGSNHTKVINCAVAINRSSDFVRPTTRGLGGGALLIDQCQWGADANKACHLSGTLSVFTREGQP
jgi:hypothetical protein